MRVNKRDVIVIRTLCIALLALVIVKVGVIFTPVEATATAEKASETKEVIERVVNVYSARKEHLMKPLFERFTDETGIKVNFVTDKAAKLVARLNAEGVASPADVFLTADVANLEYAREQGVIRPFSSELLAARIPENYRREVEKTENTESSAEEKLQEVEAATKGEQQVESNPSLLDWVGLTLRSRAIFYAKDRVKLEELSTYESLADEAWKERVVIRSSSNVYNQSLLASIIEANGKEKAEIWAKAIVGNMARKPQGGDTDQIRAVAAGEADIAIANSYYYGRLLASDKESDKAVVEKVGIFFPNQAEGQRGAHVNISGGAVARYAKNEENSIKLLEYLASDEAQRIYAEGNHEYPVVEGVALSDTVKAFGDFKRDVLPLSTLSTHRAEVLKMFDRVGWR